MLRRLLVASSSFRFLRALPVRFCGWASKVYFWPLIKVHGLPWSRPYSRLRMAPALLHQKCYELG